MSWAAANAPKRRVLGDDSSARRSEKQGSSETVEAALARLSKGYTTAMECIGSLHKTNKLIIKEKEKGGEPSMEGGEALDVLIRVSRAARTTLEKAVLTDLLVQEHIPCLLQEFVDRNHPLTGEKQQQRAPPPILSSEAHKSTVRELAYLALVNYSDLLLSCGPTLSPKKRTVLDHGVVRKVQSLGKESCWQEEEGEESFETTQRFALAALCDASKLDGTDPIMWLKLACAARQLQSTVQNRNPSLVLATKYRRLVKYALECGTTALPPQMPPNRAIVRARNELEQEKETAINQEYETPLLEDEATQELVVLELPRYSWSIFGRMLVRVCREGTDYQSNPHNGPSAAVPKKAAFGAPAVLVKLNPMLALPPRLLRRICDFLDTRSTVRFEMTCRGISFSMMDATAAASYEHENKRKMSTSSHHDNDDDEEEEPNEKQDVHANTAAAKEGDANDEPMETDEKEQENKDGKEKAQSSRTSKRLRSQQITSGKIAERQSNRKSFEYCFLAATMSCTKAAFKQQVQQAKKQESRSKNAASREWNNHATRGNQAGINRLLEAKERTSTSSLVAFVEQWGARNCDPIDLLRKCLGHVAMNVHDVFVTDPRGPLELTASILTGFDLFINRTARKQRLALLFFEPVETTGSFKASLELFALDLLYCELLLKRCERYFPTHVDFDDDSNVVACMVLPLLEAFDALEQSKKISKDLEENLIQKFHEMGIRSKWLGAGFYLWRRGISQVVFESREAEDEAVYYIDEASKAFDLFVVKFPSVATPHLVSPGRTEAHWKEIRPNLLSKLRDDIQASSVVSHAKQSFQELIEPLAKSDDQPDSAIVGASANTLASIGENLFERYRESYDKPGAKHMELVEDFLSVHGQDLSALVHPGKQDGDDESVIDPIPIQSVRVQNLIHMSNPSILSILTTCFNVDNEHREHSIRILAHVALTAKGLFDELLAKLAESLGEDSHGEDSDSDDDSMMSDDESHAVRTKTRDRDELKAYQCVYFVIFLIGKITAIFSTVMDDEERKDCCMSSDCSALLSCMFALLRDWTCGVGKRWLQHDDTSDQILFNLIVQFMEALRCSAPSARCKELERFFFAEIARTVIAQANSLLSLASIQGTRIGRATRQKLCIKKAELLGLVLNELGHLLSENLVTIDDFQIRQSEIISVEADSGGKDSSVLSKREAVLFCDAVLRLWRYGSLALSDEDSPNDTAAICSSFDRPIVRSIQTPLILAITGLCGSAIRTASWAPSDDSDVDQLCLTDFYDSDASANEWLLDSGQSFLLRRICHAVHCINIVINVARDKDAVSNLSGIQSRDNLGPLLPLVATRVLNFFADSLLVNFGPGNDEASRKESLWVKEYPYTTRSTGEVLDLLLRRSYRWLFGFSLVGEKEKQTTGKDSVASTSSADNPARNSQPESTSAAAQLYRCIVRTYPSGRRSPPKAALEVASSALPPIEETKKSRILKEFIFQSNRAEMETELALRLMEKAESWNRPFEKINDLLHKDQTESESESGTMVSSPAADDAYRVRRGISSELASGQVPVNLADTGHKGKSDSSSEDERMLCSKHEQEASKKFFAIIDDICLGNAKDTASWCRAAQCVTLKAELIADRLGLTKGYARSDDFSVPSQRRRQKTRLALDVLEAEQRRKDTRLSKNWVTFIGEDLSVFVRHSWSSFTSLQACSEEIKKRFNHRGKLDKNRKTLEMTALNELERMHGSKKLLEWQEAWGGIFVYALKKLALRLLCTALFLVDSKEKFESDDNILHSEICEAIGVTLYSSLMASQGYGYPMHILSEERKRKIATAAKVAFERAAAGIQKDEEQETWDLIFMIGKCQEKIASTYKGEIFSTANRQYENQMSLAMSSYADALKQAAAIDDDGGHTISQQGGSSHGSTEVLYRIHASRLKCLLFCASCEEDCIEDAEAEALRLTESHWYKTQEDAESTKTSLGNQDRIWNVLADIVAGLAQCREDHHFFHRSVYRHAQALMWAPVLLDPTSREGSHGMIPATKSHTVRGLNNSTQASYSAEVIMRTLFDKKRSQLCAVWLTSTASNSPFQILNSSNRKYDSLRGKYIKAYIESLRLCNRWSELEQFTKLLCSSKRDAANYFQASALEGGNPPSKSHANDCILAKKDAVLISEGFGLAAKRQANSVFAEFIMKKITDTKFENKMEVETNLKQAYACFLRLHCTDVDIKRTSALRYGVSSIKELEALCQAFLATEHAKAVKTDSNDWSGGAQKKSIFDEALSKCRTLFPTLSGNFLFKQSSKSKDKDTSSGVKKRKRPSESAESADTSTVSFEVSVPDDVAAGEQFVTTIKYGDNVTKKVKLTVPEGNPKTLRFSLRIAD